MGTRRTIVWIISLLFGLISTAGVIFLFQTSIDKFSIGNAILVFFAAGSLAFIWLDYVLRTQYLRS
jgi:hypothetical protein